MDVFFVRSADGYVADIYKKSPKMPTYLLCLIISDFQYTETTVSGIPVRLYCNIF